MECFMLGVASLVFIGLAALLSLLGLALVLLVKSGPPPKPWALVDGAALIGFILGALIFLGGFSYYSGRTRSECQAIPQTEATPTTGEQR